MASKIEWTDETLNFATGCTKVSPGCDNCYMFRQWPRLHGMRVPGYTGRPDEVRTLSPTTILDKIDHWKRPRRIFINSMSDTFHKDVPFEYVRLMMEKARNNPRHTLQVLTKRPGRAVAFWKWLQDQGWFEWPSNVWLGTSVESAKYLPRLDVLARVPAKVRFVSAEPLLGPLDLAPWMGCAECHDNPDRDIVCRCGHIADPTRGQDPRDLNWVIVGGESGPGARPMHPQWVRNIRDQCQVAGVPLFFKQWGEYVPAEFPYAPRGFVTDLSPPLTKWVEIDGTVQEMVTGNGGQFMRKVGKKAAGALLDGREWREMP